MKILRDDIDKEILASLDHVERVVDVTPSPYLKTRVMASLRSRKQIQRLWIWKAATAMSLAGLLFFAIVPYLDKTQKFVLNTKVGDAVSLQIGLQNLKASELAYLEVELPEGLHFYSKSPPELASMQLLQISAEAFKNGEVPLHIMSQHAGKLPVKIRYYSENPVMAEEIVYLKVERTDDRG